MAAEQPQHGPERPEKQAGNLPGTVKGSRIIAYNLREEERPGRMKVRYKVKIATGRKARALDEHQAEVIMDLLKWARQHRSAQRRP
jgi:hypothetical protein